MLACFFFFALLYEYHPLALTSLLIFNIFLSYIKSNNRHFFKK
ncbi:hypothetical protein BAXH7_04069 [Bacillus amyloliquefaciens XH7]|nr:hypothetical protein BAXH7_04069 [Bacillus amyloliquefaciens XH7]